MTFVISVFILFMQFLWKYVDELVGKGLPANVVGELFFFAALSFVPLALPMAVLLSSLMTFGNLGEHYELAALKSAGMSLTRIMRPLFFLICAITIGAYYFSNNLLPYTNLKMLSTLYDVEQQKPALNIKEGVFYNDIDGYSIRIKKIEKDGQTVKDIMIYNHTDQAGNTQLTVAEYGKMFMTPDKNFFVIELHNGETYQEMWQTENASITKPFVRMKFKDQLARLDLSSFKMTRTDPGLFKDNHQMLNGSQLLAYIDTMNQELAKDKSTFFKGLQSAYLPKSNNYWKGLDSMESKPKTGHFISELSPTERARVYELAINNARNCKSAAESKVNEIDAEQKSIIRFQIEYWRKYSLSFACLLMFFIGAPLGALIRKGGLGMPVVVSIFFFLIYWVLSIVGEKLSKEGSVPPQIGMWLAAFVFAPLGLWLTKKATADKGMFDSGEFFRVIRIVGGVINPLGFTRSYLIGKLGKRMMRWDEDKLEKKDKDSSQPEF
jgi:lipopolysaccharide export system permease protein